MILSTLTSFLRLQPPLHSRIMRNFIKRNFINVSGSGKFMSGDFISYLTSFVTPRGSGKIEKFKKGMKIPRVSAVPQPRKLLERSGKRF